MVGWRSEIRSQKENTLLIKANPPKGGDAKLRVYSASAMTAGLPELNVRRLWARMPEGVFDSLDSFVKRRKCYERFKD